ncbi:MAG: shikimate dehydrogenase, partial [Acidobacteria bacterium]|nr:shikimate dehydrogenase [Acidobacteriota bacterium]
NAVFVPLQVANLDEFIRQMVKPDTREVELNFKGFAVTNPHKQSIIPHLDQMDEAAQKIGAVNTIKIIDGKLHGYNTDADGFIEPLKKRFGDLKQASVAVIGAGGAARACVYALKREGAHVTVYARDIRKAQALAYEFKAFAAPMPTAHRGLDDHHWILVNATPVGTKGASQTESPISADQLAGLIFVYDLIYNPAETRLMHDARSIGVGPIEAIGGLEMLIGQAAGQQKIWTGLEFPADVFTQALRGRLV